MASAELFIYELPFFLYYIQPGELIDFLNDIDTATTLALNFDGGRIGNMAAVIFSSRLVWLPWGLLFISKMSATYRHNIWQAVAIILGLAVVVTLCDQVSASIIKPLVERPRPSHEESISSLLHYVGGYRGGAYGFVSSHAANAFGASIYAIKFFRNKAFTVSVLIFSVLVGYSRVYLGVHYVGDVVCALPLGAGIAYAVIYTGNALRHIRRRLSTHSIVLGWRFKKC